MESEDACGFAEVGQPFPRACSGLPSSEGAANEFGFEALGGVFLYGSNSCVSKWR